MDFFIDVLKVKAWRIITLNGILSNGGWREINKQELSEVHCDLTNCYSRCPEVVAEQNSCTHWQQSMAVVCKFPAGGMLGLRPRAAAMRSHGFGDCRWPCDHFRVPAVACDHSRVPAKVMRS